MGWGGEEAKDDDAIGAFCVVEVCADLNGEGEEEQEDSDDDFCRGRWNAPMGGWLHGCLMMGRSAGWVNS